MVHCTLEAKHICWLLWHCDIVSYVTFYRYMLILTLGQWITSSRTVEVTWNHIFVEVGTSTSSKSVEKSEHQCNHCDSCILPGTIVIFACSITLMKLFSEGWYAVELPVTGNSYRTHTVACRLILADSMYYAWHDWSTTIQHGTFMLMDLWKTMSEKQFSMILS